MAVPTILAGSGNGGAADVVVTLPSHQANDILVLAVESAGGETVAAPTANGGWNTYPNSPQATGSGTAGTRISVFWIRATSGAMTNPTIVDPGNHAFGVAF